MGRLLDRLEEWIIATLMGGATALIFVAVVHRYSVGTAADIALSSGVAPRAIDIGRLQARLEDDGAYLGRSLHQVV